MWIARIGRQTLPGSGGWRYLVVALLVLSLSAAVSGGCTRSDRDGAPSAPGQKERTAALVSMSVGFHKRADIALKQNRRGEAKQEMAQLLEMTREYELRTAEQYDVRFDAATRLAQMHLKDGELARAEEVARAGLSGEEEAPATLFRGYLHQSLADILEARGDLRGAVREHGEAIDIFKAVLDAGSGE